jgi:hypothetical protein
VEIKDPVERYVADGLEKRYEKSDSIWITRADGSGNRQIGDKFDRIEFQMQHCDVVAGIFIIHGWSPDSQWISYRYNSLVGPEVPPSNIIVNINTGIQLRLPGETTVHWAPISNKVAYISEDRRQLEILDVDKPAQPSVLIPMLASTPEIRGDSILYWSLDENELFLESTSGENQSLSAPHTLWKVDLSTKEWEQIGTIESGSTMKKSPSSNRVAICADPSNNLEIRDLDEWSEIKTISKSEKIYYDTLDWVIDRSGNEYLSFFKTFGNEVWLYNLSHDPLEPQLIFDLTKIDGPPGSIVDLAWQSLEAP